jgi:hypothetical protein
VPSQSFRTQFNSAVTMAQSEKVQAASLMRHSLNDIAGEVCSFVSFLDVLLVGYVSCTGVLVPTIAAVTKCSTLVHGGLIWAGASGSPLNGGCNIFCCYFFIISCYIYVSELRV